LIQHWDKYCTNVVNINIRYLKKSGQIKSIHMNIIRPVLGVALSTGIVGAGYSQDNMLLAIGGGILLGIFISKMSQSLFLKKRKPSATVLDIS
jgi:hypothetical protein